MLANNEVQKSEVGSQKSEALKDYAQRNNNGSTVVQEIAPAWTVSSGIYQKALFAIMLIHIVVLSVLLMASQTELHEARADLNRVVSTPGYSPRAAANDESIHAAILAMPDSLFKANLLGCCGFHYEGADRRLAPVMQTLCELERNELQKQIDEQTNADSTGPIPTITNFSISVEGN